MEYVILSTPEEDALSNYFLMLSRFAFDTARDQVVRKSGVVCNYGDDGIRTGKGRVVLQQEGVIGPVLWPRCLILQ